jgi:hypothetical protein
LVFWRRDKPLAHVENRTRLLGRPTCSLVNIPTELSRLFEECLQGPTVKLCSLTV